MLRNIIIVYCIKELHDVLVSSAGVIIFSWLSQPQVRWDFTLWRALYHFIDLFTDFLCYGSFRLWGFL